MTEDELFGNMTGLFAYDTGCVSSGIFDLSLKARCLAQLRAMGQAGMAFLSRKLRDEFLSEEALAAGYSIEDFMSFVQWLDYNGYSI